MEPPEELCHLIHSLGLLPSARSLSLKHRSSVRATGEQKPANRFTPPAKRQAPFSTLNFLPAMKSGTTCTDKENRKLAKQRHPQGLLNVPEETFSKLLTLERKHSLPHPGERMHAHTQLQALLAPQPKPGSQNIIQENGIRYLTGLEL